MLLVWLSVTGKLLFSYSKQVRYNHVMRTRILSAIDREIVDSYFNITDGLCEDMDSQNPIDLLTHILRKKCRKI